MVEPTEKQIKFAESLGIENAASCTKEALSKLINEKVGGDTKPAYKPYKPQFKAPVQETRHDVVIQRTEKPHSYEFGKATARHKVYYGDVDELVNHIALLKDLGLVEDEVPLENPIK